MNGLIDMIWENKCKKYFNDLSHHTFNHCIIIIIFVKYINTITDLLHMVTASARICTHTRYILTIFVVVINDYYCMCWNNVK